MKSKKSPSGQTLLEVLVAMTVGVLVLTAITSSVLSSLINVQVSKTQNQANLYAQEGMEIARAFRTAAAGKYCLDQGETRLTGQPEGTCTTPNVDGRFVRTVDVIGNDGNTVCSANVNKMVVTVSWTDTKCTGGAFCHKIQLDSCATVIAAAGTITPTLAPTSTPIPQEDTLDVVDDAKVRSSQPTTNFGTTTDLQSDSSYKSLMKFDTASLVGRTLQSAKLVLTPVFSPIGTHAIKEARNEWEEEMVTWNTQPISSTFLGSYSTSPLEIDVTSRIQGNLGYPVSFLLEPFSGAGATSDVRSKEYTTSSLRPKLVIKTGPGSYSLSTPFVASSTPANCSGQCNSLQFQHPVSGNNRLLVVGVNAEGGTGIVSSVTYSGQSLLKLPRTDETLNNTRTQLWYLLSPPVGTATVNITLTGNSPNLGTTPGILAIAATLNNASSQYPFISVASNAINNYSTGSFTVSNLVDSSTADLLMALNGVDCDQNSNPVLSTTLPQIEARKVTTLDKALMLSYKPNPGSATTMTTSWTGSGCFYGSVIAAGVRGVVTSGSTTPVAFVTGKTLGTVRNNFTGSVGMKITVGSSPLTVVSLGRIFVTGNTGTHLVKITKVSDGSTVGSVSIPMSGGTSGQFQYGTLGTAALLQANTAYYVTSDETNGADQWYDVNTAITTTPAAIADSGAYFDGSWHTLGGSGNTYGPVDFKIAQ